jgi:hypothetical protein
MNTLRPTVVMTKSSSFRLVCSIGIIALMTSIGAKTNALESSESLMAQRLAQPPFTESTSQQESGTADASNNQQTNSANRSSDKQQQPDPKAQKDGTVSIDDVPLECRSYFPSAPSGNLFCKRV